MVAAGTEGTCRRPCEAPLAWLVFSWVCLHSHCSPAGAAAAGAPPATAWNFAFGSNMDAGTRARRGLQPEAIVPAYVAGWELTFSLAGAPFLEPAFASVRPAPTEDIQVHGVCLQLDREGWLRLLLSEGVFTVPTTLKLRSSGAALPEILAEAEAARRPEPGGAGAAGYRLQRVEVQPYTAAGQPNGSPLPDCAYVLTDVDGEGAHSNATAGMGESLLPSERYWRLLRNGSRRHALHRDYRSFLWSLPRFAPSPLGAAALLPALLAAAAARRLRSRRSTAAPSWPRLEGPLAAARGRVLLGPDVPAFTWSVFCSEPRQALLDRLRQQLGPDLEFVSYC